MVSGDEIEMTQGATDQPLQSARQRFIDTRMRAFPSGWQDRMPHTSDPRELEAALERLSREHSLEEQMKAQAIREGKKGARRRR